MSRVLVVYGSETGQTKDAIQKVVKDWSSAAGNKFKVVNTLEGDKAADEWETITSSNYDFILVSTSSYGDGDAPSGFGKFLYKLQAEAAGEGNHLKGMQHAVLGFGSTSYETFQNCPRLADKVSLP